MALENFLGSRGSDGIGHQQGGAYDACCFLIVDWTLTEAAVRAG